ncbi:MAG: DUF5675 family protein [Desulfovibrionaceae bacterium]
METMQLIRLEFSDAGVFGVLCRAGQIKYCTLEPPYFDNRQFISCISLGSYRCRRRVSPRFGETFEICGVPGRENILFHAGNTLADTSGCVLLGQGFGSIGGVRGVVASRAAVRDFLAGLDGVSEFSLAVQPLLGGGRGN